MIIKLRSQNGMSMIELVLVVGIMGIVMFSMISVFTQLARSGNYVEFQGKKEQIRQNIIGQFLNNADNCKCLFAGATPFPTSGTATLGGPAPTQIGNFNFVTAGDCSTATVPAPYLSTTANGGLRANAIQLRNIIPVSGSYEGDLFIDVESTKDVLGPKNLPLSFHVALSTTTVGASVNFNSCSFKSAATAPGVLDVTSLVTAGPVWQNIVMNHNGGSGYLATPPYISLGSNHIAGCGPVYTVTLTNPAVTSSTRAAQVAFFNTNNNEAATSGRVFTTAMQFVGGIGQAGRGGDGRSADSASEMMVPLNNRQFRMQACRRGSGTSRFYFSVKGVVN